MAEAGMDQLAKRAKAKARLTKALQRANPSPRRSQRMEKERPRKVMRRARANMMIDPKGQMGKEKVTSNATYVANLATTQRTVGRTAKCEQFQMDLKLHRTTWRLIRMDLKLFKVLPQVRQLGASLI